MAWETASAFTEMLLKISRFMGFKQFSPGNLFAPQSTLLLCMTEPASLQRSHPACREVGSVSRLPLCSSPPVSGSGESWAEALFESLCGIQPFPGAVQGILVSHLGPDCENEKFPPLGFCFPSMPLGAGGGRLEVPNRMCLSKKGSLHPRWHQDNRFGVSIRLVPS